MMFHFFSLLQIFFCFSFSILGQMLFASRCQSSHCLAIRIGRKLTHAFEPMEWVALIKYSTSKPYKYSMRLSLSALGLSTGIRKCQWSFENNKKSLLESIKVSNHNNWHRHRIRNSQSLRKQLEKYFTMVAISYRQHFRFSYDISPPIIHCTVNACCTLEAMTKQKGKLRKKRNVEKSGMGQSIGIRWERAMPPIKPFRCKHFLCGELKCHGEEMATNSNGHWCSINWKCVLNAI